MLGQRIDDQQIDDACVVVGQHGAGAIARREAPDVVGRQAVHQLGPVAICQAQPSIRGCVSVDDAVLNRFILGGSRRCECLFGAYHDSLLTTIIIARREGSAPWERNMDNIQLRPATQADVPAVLAVTAAAYREYAGRLQPDAGALHETVEAVERYLHAGGVIVAQAGGAVVGAVRYEPREDFVYLGRLAVLPGWRGRGIGQRLVEAVEDWAILLGLDEVRLGVRLELVENRELYTHLGYVEDGLSP